MKTTITWALSLTMLFMSACSKNNNDSTSGGTGGTGVDNPTGPTGAWLSTTSSVSGGDSIITDIYFNSDHTIQKVITISEGLSGALGDTSYTTVIPVYSGGRLTELQAPPDSTSTTGPVTATFVYGSNWIRVGYNPGSASYNYDSLVIGGGEIMAVYVYTAAPSGPPVFSQSEVFTWNGQQDISQVLVTSVDPSTGSTSMLTAEYTYDGSFNAYKTVKDLAFMIGSISNNVGMLTANNPSTVSLTGYNGSTNYIYQYNSQSLPTTLDQQSLQQGALKSSTFAYFQYIEQN
jgi:hypothetical protein